MNEPTRRQEQLTDEVIRRANGCLPAEEIAALYDGTIRHRNRETLEAHLPGCMSCRAALDYLASEAAREPEEDTELPAEVAVLIEAAVAATIYEEPETPPRSTRGPIWMTLVAGVLFAGIFGTAGYLWWSTTGFDQDPGGPRGTHLLEILAPVGTLETTPDAFRWIPHPLARSYSVVLFDEDMTEVWTGRTAGDETELPLDDTVLRRLAGGGRFNWQVVALDSRNHGFEHSPIGQFEIAAAPSTR